LSSALRSLIREPLVHFLLAGAAIFLFSAWRGEPVDPASRTITVDGAQVSRLTASFAQTWQRAPRPDEIDALIREHIKEEVYSREAIRLGLDADDPIIRRRLRAKMEFLSTSAVDAAQPDEATLAQWLARNPAKYATGALYSFDQIYLGEADQDSAVKVRKAITAGANWKAATKPFALPSSFESSAKDRIASDFGDAFATAVIDAKLGQWVGPVTSGFGTHLVRVRSVSVAQSPRLADVHQAVENDWRAATRAEREAKAYQTLLDSYTIKIARP
jgi:peptidyl-prolyl cis-trans isomerase C